MTFSVDSLNVVRSAVGSMLAEFHRTFADPRDTPQRIRRRRAVLHEEEHAELIAALQSGDRVEIARELADLVYVAYGTADVYAIDLDTAIAEVHRANMSKLGEGGEVLWREDGKVLKGPNFRPPDMSSSLRRSPLSSDDRQAQ